LRVFGRYFVLLCAWAPAALGVEVRLNQADGDELLLTGPVARIVTLAPHLAEGVYAAGAGDRLVATVEYSEYPADAAGVPRIGDAFRLDI
jgi:iron complex transport system substrate-binding protein